jgi:hypothetical protein
VEAGRVVTATTTLDLTALLLLSAQERLLLDGSAHGELVLAERCFFKRELLFEHRYPSFVAALDHVDELFAQTPRAFTEDHGPILLVLSEVTQ